MDETQGSWDRLAAVNMTMHRRMVEYLNAAIGAVNLAANTERAAQMAWRQHAVRQIMRAHNTFTAWSSLIRYKAGDSPTIPAEERVFRFGDFLDWLSAEMLQKREPNATHDELMLRGGRETLQEALILLYSCAFGLGPSVKLINDPTPRGVLLGVRYRRHGDVPLSLNALLTHPAENWRLEHLAFELGCARDFLTMNGCDLRYEVDKKHCSLTFFIPAVRQPWTRRLRPRRLAGQPLDAAETILTEEGLRKALLDAHHVEDDDDGDDHDSTHDSDVTHDAPTQL